MPSRLSGLRALPSQGDAHAAAPLPGRRKPEMIVVTSFTTSIALSISGHSRSEPTLRRFAASLHEHALRPAKCQFDAFLWMHDSEAEALLRELLKSAVDVIATSADGTNLSDDEDTALPTEHDPSTYGSAWNADQTPNVLRMLYKLRGVERLRLATQRRRRRLPPRRALRRKQRDRQSC